MNAQSHTPRSTTVHLIHSGLEAKGMLHYLPEKKAFEIIMEPSETFDFIEPQRIPLTKWMMDHLAFLPNGDIRLEY